MNSYRSRLIYPLTIIILIVLVSLGVILAYLFKEFYYERMNDRVTKETEVVSIFLDEINLSDSIVLQEKIDELANSLALRITVIDTVGQVMADSAADPGTMGNHLQRPEISDALHSGAGHEIRYSETLNSELIYYAIPYTQQGEILAFVRLGMPIDEFRQMYHNIWIILVFSFFFAFLIILFFAFKITNQLASPIEDARKVANQLAEGNYSARTYEAKTRETGELNQSINVLAGNLERITKTYESQKERLETVIENMGSGLILIDEKGDITLVNRSCKDIFQENTDQWLNKLYYKVIKHKEVIKLIQEILLKENRLRRHVSIDMEVERRHIDVHGAPIIGTDDELKGIVLVFLDITELKKLEQGRKDFVANVSHELKTPVTSIKGFTETLLDGAMNDEALRKQFLTIISVESERLESLINDLFELSRIEGAKFVLDWQLVDLEVLTKEVFLLLAEKAEMKKISLESKVKGKSLIHGDPHRLKQVLINIINNGINYTPEGGEVSVRIIEQVETVVLKVKDTGIGIRKKEIPRLFERFYRVDPARSRNSGGTGLGLAIVKHLVEAHKGKISVESEIGKGSLFQIVFFKDIPEDISNMKEK